MENNKLSEDSIRKAFKLFNETPLAVDNNFKLFESKWFTAKTILVDHEKKTIYTDNIYRAVFQINGATKNGTILNATDICIDFAKHKIEKLIDQLIKIKTA